MESNTIKILTDIIDDIRDSFDEEYEEAVKAANDVY